MMFSYNNGMNGWGMTLMVVAMVIFWSIVVAGVVFLVRSTRTTAQPAAPATYEHVLAARFAHGDIDETEYRNRLAVLRGQSPTGTDK
ncbi:SHOCT domain-containing protein [Modestobacter sp. Leaf380]|uniref:SHOCT domain-containing protein n=1 Tax=Modestobacter sp. Leaf380 TaxID=1736356 RepID=UPI0006FF07F4|nr:hypothetical protein [Modestobacter sp. Leaf380]KQS64298.1 hypothetical protein ASG41_16685 [Modestobacter sp. Leaf380]